MKYPGTDALNTAIAWLRCNNGRDGEMERCEEVAAWLEHEEGQHYLRQAARQAGVPIGKVREMLTRAGR